MPAAVKVDTAFADTLFSSAHGNRGLLADSQPQKAAQTAAEGLEKFPNNVTLMQLGAQANLAAGQTQAGDRCSQEIAPGEPEEPGRVGGSSTHAYMGLSQYDSAMAAAHRRWRTARTRGKWRSSRSRRATRSSRKAMRARTSDTLHHGRSVDEVLRFACAASGQPKFIAGRRPSSTVGLQYGSGRRTRTKTATTIKQAESDTGKPRKSTCTVAAATAADAAAAQILTTYHEVSAGIRTARENRM